MNRENIWERIGLALSIGTLFAGLTILFSGLEQPKIIGLIATLFSLFLIYFYFRSKHEEGDYTRYINTKNMTLGLLLILLDLIYNIYTKDHFGPFDYGMIASGLAIILLNAGSNRFLKLDEFFVNFSTNFIFVFMILYGLLFTGIPFIFGDTENFLIVWLTVISTKTSAFFLNFIKPTAIDFVDINFDGFRIGIWTPCSGAHSITVFLSAVIGYFITIREKNVKRIIILSLIGVIMLFFMNIGRIIILVLTGYYFGAEPMLFVHQHLGWIMFVLGMGVFWYIVMDD